jgi:hypothetical protein
MNVSPKTPAPSRTTHNAVAANAVFSKSYEFACGREPAPSLVFRARYALFCQFLPIPTPAIAPFSIASTLFRKNTRVGIPPRMERRQAPPPAPCVTRFVDLVLSSFIGTSSSLRGLLHRRKNIHTLLCLTRTRRPRRILRQHWFDGFDLAAEQCCSRAGSRRE